jgi:hypothetical protein
MNQLLKPTVACLAVLGMFGMQGLCAQDDPDRTAALQSTTDHSGRSLHIDGDAAALHVVVQQTTIADVLSALAGFNVRYRSSIALDEMRDGSYAGSLGHVVARLLNGYDYATTQDGARLEVTIIGKGGEAEMPGPIAVSARRQPSN